MDAFHFLLPTLLTLVPRAACADDTTELIGAVGGSITFNIHNPAGDAAFWNFGNDPIVTVTSGDPPKPLFSEDKYKRRFSVSEDGRALSISRLSMEDAGIYVAKTGAKTSTFTLRVYRELPELMVTCEAQNCSAGRCRLSLRCSAPGAGLGNVSYTWVRGEETWDEGLTVLLVEKSPQDEPEQLTCTAQNPVSSRTVTVTTRGGLCAANAAHTPGPGRYPGSLGRVLAMAVAEASIFLLFHCRG